MIRSGALLGYHDLAAQFGLNANALLRSVKIDPKAFENHEKMISSQAFVELLEVSAEAAKCPDFGLRLSLNRGIKTLGAIGLLSLNEPNVERALQTISQYLHFHNEGLRVRMEVAAEASNLSFTSEFGSPRSTKQTVEMSLGVGVQFLRMLLGPEWNPIEVCFAHSAPPDMALYRRIFRAPVRFDQGFNGLILYTEEFKKPIRNADDMMRKYLLCYIDSLDSKHGDDIVSKTRRIINDLLSSTRCSKTLIAKYMGIDARTLQRKLGARGYTFKGLMDEVRASLSAQHLANSKKSLTEIAEILGYSEVSAFSRFFQRIYGSSPSMWRRENNAITRTIAPLREDI